MAYWKTWWNWKTMFITFVLTWLFLSRAVTQSVMKRVCSKIMKQHVVKLLWLHHFNPNWWPRSYRTRHFHWDLATRHCEMCLSIYIVDNAVVAQDHLFIAQPACDVFQSLEVETTPTNLAVHGKLKVRKGKKNVLFVLLVIVALGFVWILTAFISNPIRLHICHSAMFPVVRLD